jgi:hypothetical protein
MAVAFLRANTADLGIVNCGRAANVPVLPWIALTDLSALGDLAGRKRSGTTPIAGGLFGVAPTVGCNMRSPAVAARIGLPTRSPKSQKSRS